MPLILAILVALAAIVPAQPLEEPRLTIIITPGTYPATPGEPFPVEVTFTSTADVAETVHFEIDPGGDIDGIAEIWTDSMLGFADCAPTLIRIVCDAPIRRWSPVVVRYRLNVPALDCAAITVRATATLPGRQAGRSHSTPIASTALCSYLPLILR